MYPRAFFVIVRVCLVSSGLSPLAVPPTPSLTSLLLLLLLLLFFLLLFFFSLFFLSRMLRFLFSFISNFLPFLSKLKVISTFRHRSCFFSVNFFLIFHSFLKLNPIILCPFVCSLPAVLLLLLSSLKDFFFFLCLFSPLTNK